MPDDRYFNEDTSQFPDVRIMETTDDLDGGDDGALNKAPRQLAHRTDFLKSLVETLQGNTYTKSEVDQLVNNLIDGAPDALNTLNELAEALNENDSELAALLAAINDRLTQAQADDRYVQLISQRNKNLIINGGFDIWQRGNSFSGGYSADRWVVGGVTTVDKNSTGTPSGFNLNARIDRSVAGTAVIYQRIEAFNASYLQGQLVSVSFEHIPVGGIVDSIDITLSRPASTADDFSSVTTIQTINITDTSSGRKVLNFNAMPTEVNLGLELKIEYNISSAADWRLTGVQLEKGSYATDFEKRSISEELALCQRYYQTRYPNGSFPSDAVEFGLRWEGTGNPSAIHRVTNINTMRDVPSISIYSTTGLVSTIRNLSLAVDIGVSILDNTAHGFSISAGGTQPNGNDLMFHYTADAEL